MNREGLPVLEINGVAKRFARGLRTSLRYGVIDTLRDLTGLPPRHLAGKDEFWAVDDISFSLQRGESLGLMGANGAGKSTLLKMIAGLLKPDRGSITIRGRVGALIELSAGMHPLLSGRENIRINAAVLGLTPREVEAKLGEIIAFADLGDFIDSPVQSYSSGMRVRLGFAVAAHLEPDLLLIDEVLAVGDTAFRLKCYQRILELRAKGTVIVLVSHQPIDLLRVTQRGLYLQRGRLERHDEIRPLLSHYLRELAHANNTTDGLEGSVLRIQAVKLSAPSTTTMGAIECAISVEVRASVSHLRILVHIESTGGDMLGSFASTMQDFNPELSPGRHRIIFRLRELPLLAGEYYIHAALHGERIDELYDVWRHRTILTVTGREPDPFGFGVYHHVHFPHEWLPVEKLS